jgi:hypothetical protein
MATRKKKSDSTKLETRMVKESHLTITYDANNYPVNLEWDDEALMRDVRAALLKAESNIPASTDTTVKPKRTKKSK